MVSGQAEVTRGEEVLTLGPDESTYIPIGMKHRLANRGVDPLEVIEVQSGSYLERTILSDSMTCTVERAQNDW